MKILITCCLLFSFLPNLAAQKDKPQPSPGVTYENYLLLKSGMKYPEIAKLLGKDGVEVSRGEAGLIIKQKMVAYRWDNESTKGRIVVIFQNGKLTNKTQRGLQ